MKTLQDYNFPSNFSPSNKDDVYKFLTEIYDSHLDGSHLFYEKQFQYYFPDVYNELNNFANYPESFSFSQKLYHFFNDDKELKLGICPVCGKRCHYRSSIKIGYGKGYHSQCFNHSELHSEHSKNMWNNRTKEDIVEISSKIKNAISKHTDEDKRKIQEKRKKTCLEKYGHENVGCFGSPEYINSMMNHYGVDNPFKSEEVKKKMCETKLERYGDENFKNKEKAKQTKLERYDDENYSNDEKRKQTNLERYGVEYYPQSDSFKENFKNPEWLKNVHEKQYRTKKKNHTFNSSTIEKEFANWLTENNFKFESQYRSEEYPFACDFYLSDYKLYAEIQGHWTHGFHPFDKDNEEDILKLNSWKSKNTKFYKTAIKVWTKSDVKKREMAKENNLNYLEIFSIDIEKCKNSLKQYIAINGDKYNKKVIDVINQRNLNR